jgi:hypothetical protein
MNSKCEVKESRFVTAIEMIHKTLSNIDYGSVSVEFFQKAGNLDRIKITSEKSILGEQIDDMSKYILLHTDDIL